MARTVTLQLSNLQEDGAPNPPVVWPQSTVFFILSLMRSGPFPDCLDVVLHVTIVLA